jgi:hypothetical protein
MKKIFAIIILATITIAGIAQNENDALRYSRLSYGGTARFMGLGGAFGALGADFSTLSQNPAGIGLYRKSEFTITPQLITASTDAEFFGQTNSDSKYNFNLGNVGMVMNLNLGGNRDASFLKYVNFGFGMNRVANFNNRMIIGGFNDQSSLLTQYMYEANNNGEPLSADELDQFGSQLAYNTDVLVYDSSANEYWVDAPNGGILQRKISETWGTINEMVLSAGANFGDKLFLGATVGFPYIRYEEDSRLTETDSKGDISYFKSFTKHDNLVTRGSGINAKIGMIYRPVDFLRIGFAVHTPTSFNEMEDEWYSTVESEFDNGQSYSKTSQTGRFNYKISTPLRLMGNIGLIIGQNGLISADYEYLDYSTARLRSSSYGFYDENDIIRTNLAPAHNVRLGAEWKYQILSLRGGFGYYGSPYVKNLNVNDGSKKTISCGIGVHEQGYFVDLAYVHSWMSDDYYLYDASLVPAASTTLQQNYFAVTLGFRY